MNKLILEAAKFLRGLPKHWIVFLTKRYGKIYKFDGVGEHSKTIPIEGADPGQIRKLLKDQNNLAIIGRIEDKPLFMISKHNSHANKYHIFEVKSGKASYGVQGKDLYYGGLDLEEIIEYKIHILLMKLLT